MTLLIKMLLNTAKDNMIWLDVYLFSSLVTILRNVVYWIVLTLQWGHQGAYNLMKCCPCLMCG